MEIVEETKEVTYTFTLSEDEASIIKAALGAFQSVSPTSPLWHAMSDYGIPSTYSVKKPEMAFQGLLMVKE